MPFKAEPIPLDLVDASERSSDLPPVARSSINGLDCLEHQDTTTFYRKDADGSGGEDA
jgi:hypothetical protein